MNTTQTIYLPTVVMRDAGSLTGGSSYPANGTLKIEIRGLRIIDVWAYEDRPGYAPGHPERWEGPITGTRERIQRYIDLLGAATPEDDQDRRDWPVAAACMREMLR